MKALLDTNIIIHREANQVVNEDIGNLFKWLDKVRYIKCIHSITITEIEKHANPEIVKTFKTKLQSYECIKTTAPIDPQVNQVSQMQDIDQNDKNDTVLINELFCGKVNIFISEDKKIHKKAQILNIADRVFTIDSFLEKIMSENPALVEYKVLGVAKKLFGQIDLRDPFFDSFKEDYSGFVRWFNSKSEEVAYVTYGDGKLLSFLYLKIENNTENYVDITPVFVPKKRLKIGTFKVISNGLRLGERFLKIIFDNALINHVDEIYVTIFNKRDEQKRLILLLEEWGFSYHGIKKTLDGEELVYKRIFGKLFDNINPKNTYPFVSKRSNIFLVPIYPEYHTELLPDSILKTESPNDFVENQPHRNAISKVYISRSIEKNLKVGDIIIFYRTGGYHKSVITTLGIVESLVLDIKNETDFIAKCRKRSVFTDEKLKAHWNYLKSNRPFIVNFLYTYSFPKRINLKKLIELGIIPDIESAPRGFLQVTNSQFELMLKETETDESIVVD